MPACEAYCLAIRPYSLPYGVAPGISTVLRALSDLEHAGNVAVGVVDDAFAPQVYEQVFGGDAEAVANPPVGPHEALQRHSSVVEEVSDDARRLTALYVETHTPSMRVAILLTLEVHEGMQTLDDVFDGDLDHVHSLDVPGAPYGRPSRCSGLEPECLPVTHPASSPESLRTRRPSTPPVCAFYAPLW